MATARPQMRCTAQSHAFTPPESGGRIKELSTAAPHCPLFFQEGNFSSCTSGEQKPPERFKPRYEQRGRTVLYSVLLDARFSASQAEHCVSGALHTTSIMDRGYATRTKPDVCVGSRRLLVSERTLKAKPVSVGWRVRRGGSAGTEHSDEFVMYLECFPLRFPLRDAMVSVDFYFLNTAE